MYLNFIQSINKNISYYHSWNKLNNDYGWDITEIRVDMILKNVTIFKYYNIK